MTFLLDNTDRFACYPKDKNYGTWFEILFTKDDYEDKFKELGKENLDIIFKFITTSSEKSITVDDIIFMRVNDVHTPVQIPTPATFNSLDY